MEPYVNGNLKRYNLYVQTYPPPLSYLVYATLKVVGD